MDDPNADVAALTMLIVIVLAPLVFALLSAYFAGTKGRSKFGWGIAGFFLGAIPLLILAFCGFLCPKCKLKLTNKQRRDNSCPNCTKLEADTIKPITVPDFLGQSDNKE